MWRRKTAECNAGRGSFAFCILHSASCILLLALPLFATAPLHVTDVTKDLVCLCGDSGCPNLIVATCTCDVAARTTKNIQAMIDAGQTKEQILARYVADQGERVLAEPTKRGWNLSAWIVPFASVLVGCLFALAVLRRWVRRYQAPEQPALAQAPGGKVDDIYRKKLQQQLKDFD